MTLRRLRRLRALERLALLGRDHVRARQRKLLPEDGVVLGAGEQPQHALVGGEVHKPVAAREEGVHHHWGDRPKGRVSQQTDRAACKDRHQPVERRRRSIRRRLKARIAVQVVRAARSQAQALVVGNAGPRDVCGDLHFVPRGDGQRLLRVVVLHRRNPLVRREHQPLVQRVRHLPAQAERLLHGGQVVRRIVHVQASQERQHAADAKLGPNLQALAQGEHQELARLGGGAGARDAQILHRVHALHLELAIHQPVDHLRHARLALRGLDLVVAVALFEHVHLVGAQAQPKLVGGGFLEEAVPRPEARGSRVVDGAAPLAVQNGVPGPVVRDAIAVAENEAGKLGAVFVGPCVVVGLRAVHRCFGVVRVRLAQKGGAPQVGHVGDVELPVDRHAGQHVVVPVIQRRERQGRVVLHRARGADHKLGLERGRHVVADVEPEVLWQAGDGAGQGRVGRLHGGERRGSVGHLLRLLFSHSFP